jgi:hypothetical protein
MRSVPRGVAVGVLQLLLVLSVAGKYAWERERLPRVWTKTAPYDPNLPIRGRYVSLRLEVAFPDAQGKQWSPVALSAENGTLTAHQTAVAAGVTAAPTREGWALNEPVAYFIPEHAIDPSFVKPGEELWVEVTVPHAGPPRPLRLGIKRDGKLTPLDVR